VADAPANAAAAPAPLPLPAEEPPHPPYHDLLDALFPVPSLADVLSLAGAREYALLGAPGAAGLFVEWGAYECLNLIAGAISKTVLAAQAILGTTATLSFMPFLGFSVACCIRVGNYLGELKPAEARRAYHVTVAISGLLVAVNPGVVLVGWGVWAFLFTDDEVVAGLVSEVMFILALYTLFDGVQCVSVGALRGVSLPGTAAAVNVVSYIAIGLPLAYLLSNAAVGLGLGLAGVWLGFVLAVLTAALCMTVMLGRCDWGAKAEEARARGGKVPAGGH
jgi:MATE family multidrug resistance protein